MVNKLKAGVGILAALLLIASVSICITPIAADNTVPPKDVETEKTAKTNTKYKLSMKNKYMKIKASAGIQIDLPHTKKVEKTKFETPEGVKMLTKAQGIKKKEINVRVR